jgi:heme exporter protein D
LAALHFGVGFAMSAVMMEMIFLRCREVPFVTAAPPTVDVKLRLIGFLVSLVSLSSGLAWIERLSLGGTTGYVSLVVFLVVLSLATALVDRVSRSATVTFDVDEELFSTQRLNLTQ